MELNPDLNFWYGLMTFGGGLLFFILSLYHAKRAWRSTPEEYVEHLRLVRPKSWRKWPIYNWLWKDQDKHPKLVLWNDRILSILGVAVSLLLLFIGTAIFLN
jgi:hypothetical protein